MTNEIDFVMHAAANDVKDVIFSNNNLKQCSGSNFKKINFKCLEKYFLSVPTYMYIHTWLSKCGCIDGILKKAFIFNTVS